jgi:hypothetical protein
MTFESGQAQGGHAEPDARQVQQAEDVGEFQGCVPMSAERPQTPRRQRSAGSTTARSIQATCTAVVSTARPSSTWITRYRPCPAGAL